MIFALCVFSIASAHAEQVAERAEALATGVNLSHWFAQSTRGYGDEHLLNFITTKDLTRIREAGFRHVRIGIASEVVRNPRALQRYVEAIGRCLDSGLTVVADFHPVGVEKNEFSAAGGEDRLIEIWSRLGAALAPLDANRVLLEVMNEPFPLEGEAWLKAQRRAVAAIRAVAPSHTIVVNPGGWSGPEDLNRMPVVEDSNVIYTVHWYAPLLFTHQSAEWTWDVAKDVAQLPWPIPRRAAERVAAKTKVETSRRALANEIAAGNFELAFLESEVDRVVQWKNANAGAIVYVGEFGVYARSAPADSSKAWIAASRSAFERAGLGWAYWDVSDSFGLVQKTANGRVFADDTLAALNLTNEGRSP